MSPENLLAFNLVQHHLGERGMAGDQGRLGIAMGRARDTELMGQLKKEHRDISLIQSLARRPAIEQTTKSATVTPIGDMQGARTITYDGQPDVKERFVLPRRNTRLSREQLTMLKAGIDGYRPSDTQSLKLTTRFGKNIDRGRG
eukprot:SAG22_NODE_424_length_10663_cov_93.402026_5_plen_144_part_00